MARSVPIVAIDGEWAVPASDELATAVTALHKLNNQLPLGVVS